MTNGEKIQQMFPNAEIGYGLRGVVAVTFIHKTIFDLDWWNSEYKEPTTKNDLGVDCISRQEVDRLACRYLKESTDNHVAFYEHFLELPSVTPQELVLDKIRAEISTVYESLDGYDPDSLGTFVSKIDEILDKYKAESEKP